MKTAFWVIFISFTILLTIVDDISYAHRCKPVDCIIRTSSERTRGCLIYIPGQGSHHVDCKYKIETHTCTLWCDFTDVSNTVESLCTIEDQPPGSLQPRQMPEACGSEHLVSYIWQQVVDVGDPPGCTSHCWEDVNGNSCLPGVDVTSSSRSGQGQCPTPTTEP